MARSFSFPIKARSCMNSLFVADYSLSSYNGYINIENTIISNAPLTVLFVVSPYIIQCSKNRLLKSWKLTDKPANF